MALTCLVVCFALPWEWSGLQRPVTEDDAVLQEEVELLLTHPVDLNRATTDELLAIPWLNPLLAYRIVALRDSLSGFRDVRQLRNVSGMTEDCYRSLLPVIAVSRSVESDRVYDLLARSTTKGLPPTTGSMSFLGRLRLREASRQVSAVVEKDRCERSWVDWAGIGFGCERPGLSLVFGDFSVSSGLGLVLSGPHRRSAAGWSAGYGGPEALSLAGSALENRNLRGAGGEIRMADWRIGGSASMAGRDAKLDSAGRVVRLVSSGTHCDSASQNRVQERSVGLMAAGRWSRFRLSFCGCGVDYSRHFAAGSSGGSFSGNSLASGSAGIEAAVGDYLVRAEAAISTGGGGAGAFELNGRWKNLAVAMTAAGYDEYYFAPLGRWRMLTGRQSRFECRARLAYDKGGLHVGLRGNTHRDFALDSLPARAELELGYERGVVDCDLRLGRSYRLDQERSRTARLNIECRFESGRGVALLLADEYREQAEGRGMMIGLAAKSEGEFLWFALTAARFDITGSGTGMYLGEYGPMRTALDFYTSRSAWRAGLGLGCRFGSGTGLGLRFGWTRNETTAFEIGTRLELRLHS